MKSLYSPVFVLLTLALLTPSYGQDEDEDASEARGRVAWIIYTSLPDDVENPVTVATGKKLIEATLSKRSTSQPIKFPADGLIRLVRKVENPNNFDQQPYQTIASIQIPAGMSKALVILSPKEEPENGLIFDSKVQNLASFDGGDYLYLNVAPVRIAVQLGEKTMVINPGESKIYDSASLSRSENVTTKYSFFDSDKEKWRMLSASTVVLHPTRREICIFSWDPRYRRVDYHGITFPVTE